MVEGYSWVPPGLPQPRVQEYMRQLPAGKVPRIGSDGEHYRERQLSLQLPRQDISSKHCSHLDPQHQSSYNAFVSARNDVALDVGHVVDLCRQRTSCAACCRAIPVGGVAVVAPKFGPHRMWHPACFVCSHCGELLVDLTYCVHQDLLYCERHYAEQIKPRCGTCDELIFSGTYTRALDRDYHTGHFTCWHCDAQLSGQRYVLTDDHPTCLPCYQSNFTHNCTGCSQPIGLDSRDVSYKDMHWHESCFQCSKCHTSLLDLPFAATSNKSIFCGSCFDADFASKCEGCDQPFVSGTKKVEYKCRQWHDTCFHCKVCKTKVGAKSFIIPNDKDIYCVPCFEDKVATKCTKCKGVLTTGGVTFRGEPWHRSCFLCANCSAPLAGQKFASREDKPYCANCFGELFAKRCTSCSKPITGQGGTRFISFEGRHWHSQCFLCALCKKSMAGRGFITDGEEIICPDCAKEKLMGPQSQ